MEMSCVSRTQIPGVNPDVMGLVFLDFKGQVAVLTGPNVEVVRVLETYKSSGWAFHRIKASEYELAKMIN